MTQSIDKMQRTVLAEAQAKAKRLTKAAQAEVEKWLTTAEENAMLERENILKKARQKGASSTKSILSGATIEFHRLWLLQREKLFTQVLQKTMEKIEQFTPQERQASLRILISEAILLIKQTDIIVRLDPQSAEVFDQEQLNQLRQSLPSEFADLTIQVEVAPQQDLGVIILSQDRTKMVDNCYSARLRKMEDDLRAYACDKLADIINQTPHFSYKATQEE